MKNIEWILSNKLEYFSKIYSNIKFILFAFSLVTILGFLLIYSYLYGYYFSGDTQSTVSNFSIISNFVPFDFRTLSMTAFYFICIFYIIIGLVGLLRNDKKNKKRMVFFLLCVAIILTIMLTLFFASNITLVSFASFSLIWIFVGLIVWFLFILFNIIFKPIFLIIGTLQTFILGTMITIFLSEIGIEQVLLQQLSFIIFILLWPVITTISIIFEKKNWMVFLNCLPITFAMYLMFIYFFNSIVNYNALLDLLFILILNIVLSYVVKIIKVKLKNRGLKKENKDNPDNPDNPDNLNMDVDEKNSKESNINKEKGLIYNAIVVLYSVLVDRKENGMKLVFGTILLLIFVITPQISMLCGKGIRMINMSENPSIKIVYVNQTGTEKSLTANYYIENNSILYISNEKWELEVIKPVNYHIK
ncbi:hypothetical protein [Lysinibacillus sphaericus]|uniref:hypothetical protein n=1 Tax=Lysinibacillus sphaericus TaxID=1421 RepID=UPI001A9E631A|nr:hypothetical protein [Lysinibacillus sphaericus]QTB25652.1 hypothetical protein J2D51_15180 [Lysinibacillus sphaericus]